MSRTLRLIAEDPSDVEVLDEIRKKKSIGITIEPVLMPDNRRGINLLPQQLPKLVETTRTAFPDDAIAVLIDAEWYKPKHERYNHKQVAAVCRESRPRVKLLWAVQETEAWILADSGICAWLGIEVENTDHEKDPKETLKGLLFHKKTLRLKSRRVLQELHGDGDEHNKSLSRVLRFLHRLLK